MVPSGDARTHASERRTDALIIRGQPEERCARDHTLSTTTSTMAAASTAVELRKLREARRKEGAVAEGVASAVIRMLAKLGQAPTPGANTKPSREQHKPQSTEDLCIKKFRIADL